MFERILFTYVLYKENNFIFYKDRVFYHTFVTKSKQKSWGLKFQLANLELSKRYHYRFAPKPQVIYKFLGFFYFTIITIPSSMSIGIVLYLILLSSKYSQNQIIFSLNLITSSIIIIHPSSTLFRTSSKKSLVLLFIPSIKTKSYFSPKEGITSSAFPFIALIIGETQAILKFSKAVSYDNLENSIVVIFPQIFLSSKAK